MFGFVKIISKEFHPEINWNRWIVRKSKQIKNSKSTNNRRKKCCFLSVGAFQLFMWCNSIWHSSAIWCDIKTLTRNCYPDIFSKFVWRKLQMLAAFRFCVCCVAWSTVRLEHMWRRIHRNQFWMTSICTIVAFFSCVFGSSDAYWNTPKTLR